MNQETGNISINTENIFPIIKKWLYSDRDIFVRELITNGVDAISKLKRLSAMGETQTGEDENFQVTVRFDKEAKTLSFTDNGIGMTGGEVKKYINQIAFSGAEDFIARYKDQGDEGSQIIGHFGLGFYSAFMVAEKVEIDSLSYAEGAAAVHWSCAGGTDFAMKASDKKERGTVITLFVGDEGSEFLDKFRLQEIITKYCSFLPVEIFLEEAGGTEDEEKKPLNDTKPLWLKDPKECSDEEYKEFYRKVFADFREPLFWIHLNVDYPFNLKGILYFPRVRDEFDRLEGKIKLYNNQVFVADNIKEVIPEFLMLLKGVIDCKDLPLNVSRSFLQKDSNVVKISRHITKKVGDKLTELFRGERDQYNGYWDDINPFIKYGCIREEKFYDRVKDIILYKSISGDYMTLSEYLEKNKSKHENQVFYVSNENQQAQYIRLFKEQDMDAVLLPAAIDIHFIQFIEGRETGVKFSRIDSDLSESMKSTSEESDNTGGEELIRIFKASLGNEEMKIRVDRLKAEDLPAMILIGEQSRRMQEMSAMFGSGDMKGMFPSDESLVLNENNGLIQLVESLAKEPERKEDLDLICRQVYDLALLSHRPLEPEKLTDFISRSNRILTILAGEK